LPKIQDAKAIVVNDSKVVVEWKIQGDARKIDHYLIVLEINGIRTVVGKAGSIGDTNRIEFVDCLDNGEHGALEYSIIPVYLDYSRGTEIRTSPILI